MFSDPEIWLCATCGEQTAADPCTVCGQPAALQDRYRLMRRLGTGESSTTWLAWDAHEAQTVAIKELPWRAGDLQARARMVREAEVLQQLSHPGVPTYIDHFWTRQGRHHAMCLIEEHVPGPTLLEEAKTRRYSRAEVLDIMEELLGTLVYLHERSPAVLHRDLKPANV
ncbi:MAG: protein kinase, partial [Myxococcota bacterium]